MHVQTVFEVELRHHVRDVEGEADDGEVVRVRLLRDPGAVAREVEADAREGRRMLPAVVEKTSEPESPGMPNAAASPVRVRGDAEEARLAGQAERDLAAGRAVHVRGEEGAAAGLGHDRAVAEAGRPAPLLHGQARGRRRDLERSGRDLQHLEVGVHARVEHADGRVGDAADDDAGAGQRVRPAADRGRRRRSRRRPHGCVIRGVRRHGGEVGRVGDVRVREPDRRPAAPAVRAARRTSRRACRGRRSRTSRSRSRRAPDGRRRCPGRA